MAEIRELLTETQHEWGRYPLTLQQQIAFLEFSVKRLNAPSARSAAALASGIESWEWPLLGDRRIVPAVVRFQHYRVLFRLGTQGKMHLLAAPL